MRRRGVPCGCTDNGGNGGCCGLKEKLAILWDRTIGSILRINGISPDGDGDFTIEAGDNINLTEIGTGNGIRIDTTGGVSYYSSGDAYVNVDNNDLEITVNAGVTGGLALQDDLDTVAGAVSDILDGTTTVPEATYATSADSATSATNATNATYLGSSSANVGSDTKPVKIVNGQAVAVTNELQTKLTSTAQVLTPRNDITGITITSRDGATGCRLITYGSIAILNISVTVSGTRSGSSGWYSLFPNLDFSNYYTPHSVGQTPAELSEGYKLYFASGTSYNYTLNTQVIFIHN